VQNTIYANKKKLKSTTDPKYYITESLTKRRLKLVKEAKNVFSLNKIWTMKGNIFCFAGNDKHEIQTYDDIQRLSFTM